MYKKLRFAYLFYLFNYQILQYVQIYNYKQQKKNLYYIKVKKT